jgi:hypothetical protein
MFRCSMRKSLVKLSKWKYIFMKSSELSKCKCIFHESSKAIQEIMPWLVMAQALIKTVNSGKMHIRYRFNIAAKKSLKYILA